MSQAHFAPLDIIVLFAYFAATLAIGLACWKKSRSVKGYTAAEGSLPGWLTGLSILGTYISSISFIANPGKSFASNWNPFVFSLSLPLAAWIGVKYFVPFYRNGGNISAYSHLEQHFGGWSRIYASTCYLLTQLARIGTVTYLMALPMQVLLGWNIWLIIIITGIVTTLYTFIGGIVGVIWTEAIQTVVLILGALVCGILMLTSLPQGPAQLFEIAAQNNKFSLGSFGSQLTESTFWVVLIYGLVINLQNFGVDQNYVQRYHAAKSEREARKSLWLGALMYVPVSAVFFFIGTALFAYYQTNPGALPADYPSDYVFPWFIVTVLPQGITGLLIASIFAAAMSTISSSLNSSATIILNDYYLRFFNKDAGEKRKMLTLHLCTIVVGLLGTVIAIAMINVKSVLDTWWNLAGIFGGGMFGLFLLGFISRRAGRAAGLTGVSACVLVILWMTFSPKLGGIFLGWQSPFHSFLTIVFGTAALLLAGFLVTIFVKPANTAKTAK